MSESLKVLNNIRSLRAEAREVSLETLEEMLEKLSAVIEDRREEEASFIKEKEKRQAKLEAIRAKLLEDGIDPEELISGLQTPSKRKSTRETRPAKYKYTDENGNERTWTGQGRTPKIIAEAIANGKKIDDFKIH
ncbi:H-NS histone family protein [Rahnella sp. L72c]|uniref:DNA-binding protein n=1 Tax=Rahnella perminowiae TaxID=2816244 RepID=A0ABS6KVK9_9GAMM|nr:H-NS family nucleoid-associated regulatory protein [Rahnella perminowiae]MBU9833645.1 H-NS histone family protein [Rahnella perminowiae]